MNIAIHLFKSNPTLEKENKEPNLTMNVFSIEIEIPTQTVLNINLFFKKKRKLFPSFKMTFQSSFIKRKVRYRFIK